MDLQEACKASYREAEARDACELALRTHSEEHKIAALLLLMPLVGIALRRLRPRLSAYESDDVMSEAAMKFYRNLGRNDLRVDPRGRGFHEWWIQTAYRVGIDFLRSTERWRRVPEGYELPNRVERDPTDTVGAKVYREDLPRLLARRVKLRLQRRFYGSSRWAVMYVFVMESLGEPVSGVRIRREWGLDPVFARDAVTVASRLSLLEIRRGERQA